MIPEAHLIASTEVDWTRYLKEADTLLARSPTRSLDKIGAGAFGLGAFLASIAEVEKPNSDPVKSIRYKNDLLRHVSFSFLVTTTRDSLFEIMQITTLAVTSNSNTAIISGNLGQWRNSVIACCQDTTSLETRILFDKIYLLLDRQGLAEIWASYGRRKLADQTFILEPKE